LEDDDSEDFTVNCNPFHDNYFGKLCLSFGLSLGNQGRRESWDVSGFVRLFYILSKNKIFRILLKIFILLRPKQSILNKYIVNLHSKYIFRQN